jgi:hypothetical protein
MQTTVLLRNNLTLRSRSERVPNAFRTRTERGWNAVGTRLERGRNAVGTRSEPGRNAFQRKLGNAFPTLAKNRFLASENPDTE